MNKISKMYRLGECTDCEEDDVYVFTEIEGFTRDYCKSCIRECVFCGKFCDWYGCYFDEGVCEFEKHDCLVDGKITCDQKKSSDKCKYRYCMNCTQKCRVCNFNTILRGAEVCSECKN
jgi:hypothetical protein